MNVKLAHKKVEVERKVDRSWLRWLEAGGACIATKPERLHFSRHYLADGMLARQLGAEPPNAQHRGHWVAPLGSSLRNYAQWLFPQA